MTSLRWWHTAVIGIAVALVVILLLGDRRTLELAGGLGALAAFLVAWFVLGRSALLGSRHSAAYAGIVIVIAGVGTSFAPNFATIQCIAFPLLWVVLATSRRAIAATILLAAAVGLGLYLSTGDAVQAFAIESVSAALSLSLGLWITSISEQSLERQRLLDELRVAQASLAALNRDAGVTSERERLTREIHDTIAQDLTALVMLTQRAQRELGDSAAGTLALLEESARTALAETRALVESSAPVGLTTGGITDALRRLGERFERETGVVVAVEVDELPALDRDAEVVLLRIAQEGLANVRKHARATAASLTTRMDEGSVALQVRDDGAGFDPDAPTDGYGLAGMRGRLTLVGGSLGVASSPAGTTLTATLPVTA